MTVKKTRAKTRKPTDTVTDNLVKAVAELQVEMRKQGETLSNVQVEAGIHSEAIANLIVDTQAVSLSDDDKMAAEDMMIGDWLAKQAQDGKTTIDLAIIEHIRTGIRLALQA